MLNISAVESEGRLKITLRGELDVAEVERFRRFQVQGIHVEIGKEWEGIVQHYDLLEFDLSGLTFIDTTGLRVMMLVRQLVERYNKNMILTNLSPLARRILTHLRLDRVFTIEHTETQESITNHLPG